MALQGTLETFSVPEVLRLLSGTRKTGLLALEGDRGVGNVWLHEGRIVSALSDHEQGEKIEAVLFDLLRFEDGSFVFETDSEPDEEPTQDVDVEEALVEAERLLEEWREIESVVPSLDVTVRLVEELSDESVTVTAEQWRSLAILGGGVTARRLGARHDMGEFDVSRLVRDLVEAGLVEVSLDAATEPAAQSSDADPATTDRFDADRPLVDHDLSHDEVATLGQNLAGFVARGSQDDDETASPQADTDDATHDDTVDDATHDDTVDDDTVDDDRDEVAAIDDTAAPYAESAEADDASDDEGDGEPATEASPGEFLSQLASLTPKTAAAAMADDVAAEPAAETDGDEEINRNLLLKFLSSAKN